MTTQSEIPWGKDERIFPWPRGDEAAYWRLSNLSILERSRAWKAVKHSIRRGSFYWRFFYWSLIFFIMQNTEHHTSSGFMWASLVFLYWWECSFPEFQLIGFFSFTYFSVKALIIVSCLLALGTINHSFPHFHFIFSNNMTGISAFSYFFF